MTGKELIRAAIAGEKVERIPWVPFTGVHAGSLIGKNATEFLQDTDAIVAGLNEAVKRYRPDGIPVVFDLQIEAEILGCTLNWSDDNPPAVTSHPLADGEVTLDQLSLPLATDGRLPIALEATRRIRAAHPDLAVYGLITGPFTLALHLLGTDIFMGMFDDPEYINKVLDFCAEIANALSEYYVEAGCDVIAVVDPMTSQIGPDQFKEFCTAPSIKVFDKIRELGALSSFFVCGHAQNNIDVMTDCHCDNISIDENIPLDFVREICIKKGVSFGGNMKLTSVMLLGTPDDNKVDAMECMELGGMEGFILAPGCDMPYATPPENVEAVADVIHDIYQQDIARELATQKSVTCNLLDMSEYGQGDKVIIDIITLDSEGCAPCQYMVEAVKAVAPEFGDLIEWHEHKIKQPESITLMSSLFVKNIPTICIDGKIRFVSRIPPREELLKAIQDRIKEKFALKINYNRGKILLLGQPEEAGYSELKENIELALKELGSDVSFDTVSELDEIHKYGVFKTPAVLTEKFTVKSTGKIAEKNIVKEWIKALRE
jgi:MtaA/CmuA family methyltransferase